MTDIFESIYAFLSQIGIPVYPENGIPSDAVLPYMTWTPIQTNWDEDSIMSVRIWDRSTNYKRLAALVDKLGEALKDDTTLKTGTGYIYLYRGTPFAQPQPLQDTDVKVMYINIGINTMIS